MNRLAFVFAVVAVFSALCYVCAYREDCYSFEKEIYAVEECTKDLNTTDVSKVHKIGKIALNLFMLIASLSREDATNACVCMSSSFGFTQYTPTLFENVHEEDDKAAFIAGLKGEDKMISDCLNGFYGVCDNDAVAICVFGNAKVENFKKCCP